MIGDSGTSMTKKIYHYYTCSSRKRDRSCKMKRVRKEWIEELVVRETMDRVLKDDVIDSIATAIVEMLNSENTVAISLKRQIKDTEKKLDNFVKAIENGVFNEHTQSRMAELDEQRKQLEIQLDQENDIHPQLDKKTLIYWLSRFKDGNVDDVMFRRKIIDMFVNAIYLYDDRIVITYNYRDGVKTIPLAMFQSSDMRCLEE